MKTSKFVVGGQPREVEFLLLAVKAGDEFSKRFVVDANGPGEHTVLPHIIAPNRRSCLQTNATFR